MARASRRRFHYVYKTTRITDGKFYIGMHSTDDMDDEYLGSGTRITRSIRKHGADKHVREILFTLLDRSQLCEKEKDVIASFRGNPLCMNLNEGGDGGWDYVNENGLKPKPGHPSWERIAEGVARGNRHPSRIQKNIERLGTGMLGKKHSVETKRKLADSQTGRKNSQFGTVWMTRDGKSVKCPNTDVQELESQGWTRGRK